MTQNEKEQILRRLKTKKVNLSSKSYSNLKFSQNRNNSSLVLKSKKLWNQEEKNKIIQTIDKMINKIDSLEVNQEK